MMAKQRFLARVFVTLKPTVNDPQGVTVKGALHTLGFPAVTDVRVGKLVEVQLDASSADDARAQAEAMCKQLLANPVIERYSFEVAEAPAGKAAKV